MAKELSMDQNFINTLNGLLETNLENEQFGVEELSEGLGLSRSQLHRKLKAINGKSASQFIREYRLDKAMDMLKNNVATASEIAYRVGFNSPSYFNTSFNQYFGYPPGEVKFRGHSLADDDEAIKSSNDEKQTITIKRKLFNRRTFLIVVLAILVLATFSYYNYSNSSITTIAEENIESAITIENSIAVLPFKNWSGDPDLEYVSDGMTDAVISRLTKIKSLVKVVPFTSIIKYKETNMSMPEIAKELGVKNILAGNFQLSGDQVKVKLQLIDGQADNHFWSDEYSGKWDSNDIFKIQASVAENVAKNMHVEISNLEFNAIQEIPTNNIEAYRLYLQAEYYKGKSSGEAIEYALPLYERAISLDSNFVEAYIGLADSYRLGAGFYGIYDEQEAWKKAKMLFQSVIEIDGMNFQGNGILYAGHFFYDWNFDLVEEYYQNKLQLTNYDIIVTRFTIAYAITTGRSNEALTVIDKNISYDPTERLSYLHKARALFYLDKKTECLKVLKSFESFFNDNFRYLIETANLYYYLGDYENFRKQLLLLMNNFVDRPPIVNWLNAVLAQVSENLVMAQNHLDELHEKYNRRASGSPAWFIALYYAHIKDYEKTFEWLQKSYDRHEVEMIWLKEEPLLRPLRTDPRYIELYDKVGFSKIAPITPYVNTANGD